MRRYNIALACAHTSKGYHYGIPATRDEIGLRGRGAFSNALLDLPPSAFNEVISVLASMAEQANSTRSDDEDDALFVSVDDLRRVAVERPELLEFIEALERREAQRTQGRAEAPAQPPAPALEMPPLPYGVAPVGVSCTCTSTAMRLISRPVARASVGLSIVATTAVRTASALEPQRGAT